MPTYQYVCTQCGRDLEVQQSFSDSSLTECPTCQGRLRKVFNAVGVVFKGSGFYSNDSRSETKASNGSAKESKDSGSDSGTSAGTDTKPAEKKTTDGGTSGGSTSSGGSSSSGSTTATASSSS